jgi:hypothetical protein
MPSTSSTCVDVPFVTSTGNTLQPAYFESSMESCAQITSDILFEFDFSDVRQELSHSLHSPNFSSNADLWAQVCIGDSDASWQTTNRSGCPYGFGAMRLSPDSRTNASLHVVSNGTWVDGAPSLTFEIRQGTKGGFHSSFTLSGLGNRWQP